MEDIVCGIFASSPLAESAPPAGRGRDLTVSWLRWNYAGDILEDADLTRILDRALPAGHRYCLVQGPGHILAEHAGPNGGKATSAFDALLTWARGRDFIFAGIPGRCVLVDLKAWQMEGCRDPESIAPVSFGATLDDHLLDLGPDLGEGAAFFSFLDDMCEKAARGVFVLNYESYDDVADPPQAFQGPVSTLYCVTAGLKPNRILETHGIGPDSRVMFFDYSDHALAFRRQLDAEWDGRDYPAYLREAFARQSGTHFYLWPGAAPDNMDWSEMERLWAAELDRWGGDAAFARHWRKFQAVEKDYLPCNILSADALLGRIRSEPGAVIWWSNAFSTIYSARHHTLDEKRQIYEDWINRLAATAPDIFIYGSDHSNSSVNGLTAADYRDAYVAHGGDPLQARPFYRRAVRF